MRPIPIRRSPRDISPGHSPNSAMGSVAGSAVGSVTCSPSARPPQSQAFGSFGSFGSFNSQRTNSYTPFHNTPSAVSNCYSRQSISHSVPHSVPQPQQQQQQQQQPQQQPQTQTQFHVQPTSPSATVRQSNLTSSLQTPSSDHLDIANHPTPHLLQMLAALLSKIVQANDSLSSSHPHPTSQHPSPSPSNYMIPDVNVFHGRNIPAISLHAYLLRILKYCPLTNEVFLSLLVYFDRIAKRANTTDQPTSSETEDNKNNSNEQLFIMDSYNIHRLIISGLTISSKFFSDVFYKNSRYAKVGGLPLEELNLLEVQFLLLCDFRLMIQKEELQRYADLLLRFWKREQKKYQLSDQQQQNENDNGIGNEQEHQTISNSTFS